MRVGIPLAKIFKVKQLSGKPLKTRPVPNFKPNRLLAIN